MVPIIVSVVPKRHRGGCVARGDLRDNSCIKMPPWPPSPYPPRYAEWSRGISQPPPFPREKILILRGGQELEAPWRVRRLSSGKGGGWELVEVRSCLCKVTTTVLLHASKSQSAVALRVRPEGSGEVPGGEGHGDL